MSSIREKLMLKPDDQRYVAKRPSNLGQILAYERILADGLRDFLSELVTVDGGIVVSYICNNQHANLGDIIGSSTELLIKPGRLHYSNHAGVDFDWGQVPSVSIALELRDERLTAFFRVVFGNDYVGVDIRGIQFVDRAEEEHENLQRFAAAVADARLERPAGGLLGQGQS
jgi:hypothetical protein